MGRLDDIANRNRDAQQTVNPLIRAIGHEGASKPAEPPARFSLPSQNRRGIAPWKVILAMILVGGLVAIYTWYDMQRERDWEAAHGR